LGGFVMLATTRTFEGIWVLGDLYDRIR
jgi:hypothetical protein